MITTKGNSIVRRKNSGVNFEKIELRRHDRGFVGEPLKVWLPRCKASRGSSIPHIHTHGGL